MISLRVSRFSLVDTINTGKQYNNKYSENTHSALIFSW